MTPFTAAAGYPPEVEVGGIALRDRVWLDLQLGSPSSGEPAPERVATTVLTDVDLYLRGTATLLAAWDEYARAATGAAVRRFPGVAVAVFPAQPERAVYNNALLQRDLAAAERADALDAMEAAYETAGTTAATTAIATTSAIAPAPKTHRQPASTTTSPESPKPGVVPSPRAAALNPQPMITVRGPGGPGSGPPASTNRDHR